MRINSWRGEERQVLCRKEYMYKERIVYMNVGGFGRSGGWTKTQVDVSTSKR